MKGLLFVGLPVKESLRDAHSSLAVLIKNPPWRLIEAVNTLRNSDGEALIKDWYDEATPFSKKDLDLIRKEPFGENVFKKEFGIQSFVGNKKGRDTKKALVGGATCNIAGFVSGHTGDGAKTLLPGNALVKIDFRLMPKMNPKKQVLRLNNHLKSKGFSDVKIKVFHGEADARTESSNSFASQVKDTADSAFGTSVLNVSNAGTGPMRSFVDVLKIQKTKLTEKNNIPSKRMALFQTSYFFVSADFFQHFLKTTNLTGQTDIF